MSDREPTDTEKGTIATPRPSDMIRKLDDEQFEVLGQIGREWAAVSPAPEDARQALPVDPDLGRFPSRDQIPPSNTGRIVEIEDLSRQRPSGTSAEEIAAAPTVVGRLERRARRAVLGAPLKNTAITHESMRKLVALPVLSADALSSVAYGPEAMVTILVLAGTAGLTYSLPIAAVIAFLMLAVGVSYRQTIRAYPHGGGSYIVSSANLGRRAGLIAAAGLMTDYVLTVSVSVSSGVAAITSAVPALHSAAVPIGVAVIVFLLAGNLRGIRQAGVLFAAPTYAFILAMFALVIVGLVTAAVGKQLPPASGPVTATEGVTILLVMRAFASGSTAMTGIEAISNAVPAFRTTRWRNARTTLTVMITILITLFLGIVVLIHLTGVHPMGNETILSQLAHLSFGTGPMYIYVQVATAAVLLLAANTAYNDFPRVLFLLARDDHAPRIFLRFGDRLAFSNGIILLTVAAAVIFVGFAGSTNALIPLYAVGVFLAFTLSQAGMVVHWWRRRDTHWRKSLAFNAVGALLSAGVLVTAAITKFIEGAWVALLVIGLFLLTAIRVRAHYVRVDAAVRLHPDAIELPVKPPAHKPGGQPEPPMAPTPKGETEEIPAEIRHLTVVALPTMDLAGLRALAYAASLAQPVLALHISASEAEAERFRSYWAQWGDHLPLEVVVSPYRAVVAPLVQYIEALHLQNPDLTITVILPEIVTARRRHQLLHSRAATRLRRALRPLPKIVITTIPFHV